MARMLLTTGFILATGLSVAWAASGGMEMKGGPPAPEPKGPGSMGNMQMPPANEPGTFTPASQVYTTNHAFLVKVVDLPDPIPYQQHFSMRISVYDGKHADRLLRDATVHIKAGMRHSRPKGFAHGMQSTPTLARKDGVDTVSGLYFHMRGRWTLQLDVQHGAKKGTAYLDLPCCGP